MASSMSIHVLGLPIFHEYYTIHDMRRNRIGFVPHNRSRKSALQSGEIPTQVLYSNAAKKRSAKIWTHIIIVGMTGACTLIYAFAIFPAMERINLSGVAIAFISIVYYTALQLIFYLGIAPVLQRALSKQGRLLYRINLQYSMTDFLQLGFLSSAALTLCVVI